MIAVGVIFAALFASVASTPKEGSYFPEQPQPHLRGVRGGEGDNAVIVEAAQNGEEIATREPACPRGELFLTCGSSCPRTCLSIRNGPQACANVCSVGCFCKDGMVRDYSGRCVHEWQC